MTGVVKMALQEMTHSISSYSFYVGDFLDTDEMNETCGKMMHQKCWIEVSMCMLYYVLGVYVKLYKEINYLQ
jgi:hypothetical protein